MKELRTIQNTYCCGGDFQFVKPMLQTEENNFV